MIFTPLSHPHHCVFPKRFHHPKQKPRAHEAITPILNPQSPITCVQPSVSVTGPALDSPAKWNPSVFVLVWLASFTQHSVSKVEGTFLAWALAPAFLHRGPSTRLPLSPSLRHDGGGGSGGEQALASPQVAPASPPSPHTAQIPAHEQN